MEKITATLDLTKIDKSRIVERKYTDKNGVGHVAKEYKIDIIPLRTEKFVTEGAWGKMLKTHFIVQVQNKEERDARADSVFIGDGFRFERPDTPPVTQKELPDDTINPDDIPF